VFAPGVELAMQTLRVANRYKDEDLITGAAVATASQRRQRKRITRSTRLVVGTPARLLELFASRKLKGVRLVVLDELESILRSRGADMLREVLSRSEPKVQLVVATATMDPASEAFVTRFMGEDVARITPEDNPLQQTISHRMVRMPPHQPPEMTLARFVQEHRCRQVIVFLTHPRHQASLYHYLRDRGLKPATLSHERSKRERRQAVEAFRRGEARILLTTDATARGLDIPGVAWVLHAGLPPSSSAYVHRAGRTGRAGESGTSVVFLDDAQRGRLRSLGKELGIRFEGYRR
jgi:superfamily II DNA/RNA helicase